MLEDDSTPTHPDIKCDMELYYMDQIAQDTCPVSLSEDATNKKKKEKQATEPKKVVFNHLQQGNCVVKHRLNKGAIKVARKGVGNTSAILTNVETYLAFLGSFLCLHAYFHYSSNLPLEVRQDLATIETWILLFFHLFSNHFYGGDNSVD
jgi:hypothetical protein